MSLFVVYKSALHGQQFPCQTGKGNRMKHLHIKISHLSIIYVYLLGCFYSNMWPPKSLLRQLHFHICLRMPLLEREQLWEHFLTSNYWTSIRSHLVCHLVEADVADAYTASVSGFRQFCSMALLRSIAANSDVSNLCISVRELYDGPLSGFGPISWVIWWTHKLISRISSLIWFGKWHVIPNYLHVFISTSQ